MEFRQLEYFTEVAKQLNFTKAAEQLCIAQSAISKSIKKLEEDLGVLLFNRIDKKVMLTAEGEVLLRHARRILEQVRHAREEIEEMRGLEKGEVRIGLPSMVGSYYFPNIILDFKKRYPHLQFKLYEQGTMKVQRMLSNGDIDMGVIIQDTIADDLEAVPFLEEEMCVCVPKGHLFAERASVTYEEVAREPLVLFQEGYFQRELIVEAGHKAGIPLAVQFETNQISLLKSLVVRGSGITLFLNMVVANDPDLVAVSLQPPVYLKLAIAWKKHAYLSIANQEFLSFLMERTAAR
ncbi:LysR family transcriptional regulator [Aneurinibacillus soli]|uniref:HTH-type transcriptional regulator CynR n=1 Tax=Aneurinibacillus soli TaxID=1500254 RepID=A0A0U5ASS2_9BACL|nr:LysR family transcriptional regulator [Aneurinibacillus soli]PYE60965.1 LysR family transcriptional regulator [Aneurinibacillus soli]BAU26869.1 HTH-type transcriptional regulator CynR [Aneurinibacillus soli]